MRRACWGLLVVAVLAGCGEGENKRADKVGETVVGQSMARAKDAVCMDNLKQIREMVQVAESSDPDGKPPADFSAMRCPESMRMCPIGKEPYEYNPETGEVKCKHPGHGKY